MTSRHRRITLAASAAAIALAAPALALATDFTVAAGTTDTTAKTLVGADTLTVQATGTLRTSGSQTVNLSASNDTGVVITNSGTIQNTGSGNRAIDTSNSAVQRTVTIINNAGATITSADDVIRFRGAATGGTVTITNAGTIQSTGGGQAIDLDALTGATVTVTNQLGGLIQGGDNDGVRPGNGGTVNNSGTIKSGIVTVYGSYDGVDFQAGGGTVNNSATGVIDGVRHGVTGGGSSGGVATTSLTVNNDGTIIGRNGSGVGSDGGGTVINHGTITGSDESAIAGLTPNGDGDGVDIDFAGVIDNFGTIQSTGALGVDSGGQPNGSEAIALGGGSVTNHAGALISGGNTGILVDDGSLGAAPGGATTITNAGTIRGLNGAGIVLVGPFNDTITNSGVISASGSNKAIDFGAGNDTLNLSTGSVITGLVDGGAGTDVINLSGTGTQGATANFETLNVLANASWSLTGAQSFTAANIAAGARLSGLANVGTLTVTGTIAPGNSIGTTAVSGNLVFTPANPTDVVYEAEVNAAGQTDLITVGGTATLAGKVSALPSASGTYANVTRYTILSAGAVSGQFSGVTSSLSYLTPFISYSGSAVTLTLLRNDVNYALAAQTPNQTAVGAAIFGAGITNQVYVALLPLTSTQASAALEALDGDLHGAVRGAVFEDGKHARGFALDRLAAAEPGGWGQIYIDAAFASANAGMIGDREGRSGLALGGDADVGGWRVGVQLGAGADSVDLKGKVDHARIQAMDTGLYAGRNFGDFALRLGGDLGHQRIHASRLVSVAPAGLNQTLTSAYTLNSHQLFGEAAYNGEIGGVAKAEPFVNVAWTQVSSGGFTEAGGNTALKHASSGGGTDVTYVTAGVRLLGDMNFAGSKLQPRLTLAWRSSDKVQAAASETLAFASGSPTFTIDGPARDKNAGLVELGLEGVLAGGGRMSVLYSGQFSDNYTSNGGRIAMSWKF